jgi:hypothetical protein
MNTTPNMFIPEGIMFSANTPMTHPPTITKPAFATLGT